MAKEKRELSPAEKVLFKWASNAFSEQPIMPDWDPDFSASFPNLWTFLTWTGTEKVKKQPGRITLQVDGTGWKVTYHDPTERKSTSAVGTTLREALAKLDSQIVKEDAVWMGGGGRNRGWRKLKE